MNGTIFMELGKYAETKLGAQAWKKLLDEAGLGFKLYLPVADYPDQEATALIAAASRITGTPAPVLLEDFGEFLVPDLIKLFGHLIKPDWKTIDLIANTESTIHEALRRTTPAVRPPVIGCERPNPREVIITYESKRKMCHLAKGIAKGIANHYGEQVIIAESSCMLRGGPNCKISVKLV
jgi:hypothetical protein